MSKTENRQRYELWEYEHGVTYMLCHAGNEDDQRRLRADGAQLVREFSAENWEDAKRKQDDFVEAIREDLRAEGLL